MTQFDIIKRMTHFVMTRIEMQDFNDKMDLNLDIYRYLITAKCHKVSRVTLIHDPKWSQS